MEYELLTHRGEKIILEDKPVSKGGKEGEVRKIITPAHYTMNCVKIYHEKNRTKEKEDKIRFMIENSPKPPAQVQSTLMIGWPIETIYSLDKEFVGFMMPLAFVGSEKLKLLTSKKKLSGDWLKFSFGNDLKYRYKLMLNIAGFMYILHHTEKYVLGDFKPDNVMVTDSGKITIIDTDSIQITEGGQLLFPGAAATPNYRPPEYYKGIGKTSNTLLEKSWDCFSLSVVFYELLLGLHPYSGCTPKFQRATNTFVDNIRDDLFPFGNNTNQIEGYPPPHDEFKKLPQNIQNLFVQSFTPNVKQRPSVEKWSEVIREILKQGKPPISVSVNSVSLSSSNLSLEVNQSKPLSAIVNPNNANQSLEWTSDDPSVVKINKNGIITALKAGTAKITVISMVDRSKSATCIVTVLYVPPVPPKQINVESLHLDSSILTLNEKQDETLIVTVLPANATNKTVIWSSSKKQVASINNGKVTAIKAGKTVITVNSTDGSNKSTECEVVVKKKINWKVFVIIGALILVIAGIVFFISKYSNEKQPASNGIITHNIEDDKKTISGEERKTETTTIIPTSVSLTPSSLSLVVGKNSLLTVTVLPIDATNKAVTLNNSNPSVVNINDQGLVTAVSEGVATITVTTVDGNKSSKCIVTVAPTPPTTINYSFGRYEGSVENGIPDGQGTMYYSCRVQIAKHGHETYYAEKGYIFVGTWGNGDIVNGKLNDSNNNQKESILAGKRPNPYNLKDDRCE